MTEQLKAATIRALYGGVVTGFSVFWATFAIVDGSRSLRAEEAGIAAMVSFSGYLVTRGVAEGIIDSNRGPTPADVGQPPK